MHTVPDVFYTYEILNRNVDFTAIEQQYNNSNHGTGLPVARLQDVALSTLL